MAPEIEIWKPILGGYYSASSLGRIRRDKGGPGAQRGRILEGKRPSSRGYIYAHICIAGEVQQHNIAKLVAEAFLGPRPTGMEINHKDANKTNNRIDNLEYTTKEGNMRHACDHGLIRKGENHPSSKLTRGQVVSMKRMFKDGKSPYKIHKSFAISIAQCERIRSGKKWAHVTI